MAPTSKVLRCGLENKCLFVFSLWGTNNYDSVRTCKYAIISGVLRSNMVFTTWTQRQPTAGTSTGTSLASLA